MKIIRTHFATIGSTNTWGKEHATEFPRDQMTLITASEQTAGRGRFNRRWEMTPDENICATFCFFLPKSRKDLGNIPQVLALSTAHTLHNFGFDPELKWPNDILLSKKKVGGILTETTPIDELLCMALGIGLNINMPQSILSKIDRPAISLAVEAGRSFDVEAVLDRLTDHFNQDLERFLAEGFSPFLEEYRSLISRAKDSLLRFHDNQLIWEGYHEGINDDGTLRLKLADGQVKTFYAGEILWT